MKTDKLLKRYEATEAHLKATGKAWLDRGRENGWTYSERDKPLYVAYRRANRKRNTAWMAYQLADSGVAWTPGLLRLVNLMKTYAGALETELTKDARQSIRMAKYSVTRKIFAMVGRFPQHLDSWINSFMEDQDFFQADEATESRPPQRHEQAHQPK